METITISVPPDIAQAYNAADDTKQQQLQKIDYSLFSKNVVQDPLWQAIAELQKQAAENGLTQEILDEILQND
ncbi:MAG: hypothetical protein HC799_09165 [Limnothrix sp. RL_2_0]|nr:hypothetical protein [Limnothrix sp. RL_2_0]